MQFEILLVLAMAAPLCKAQCSSWGGSASSDGLVSRTRINEIFRANPLIINSLEGYIYPLNKFNQLCVYEVQAPEGYCIDYVTSLFSIVNGATFSVIDGNGVFGGSYIETVTSQIMTANVPIARSTTTNVMGVVVAANAPLSSSQTGAGFTLGLHFKVRKCTEAATGRQSLLSIGTPAYP